MIMVNVNVRMNESDRDLLANFCDHVGMSISTLFNVFAKKVINENKIPFNIEYEDPFYNESNIKWINESIEQSKQGHFIVKSIEELEKMENE